MSSSAPPPSSSTTTSPNSSDSNSISPSPSQDSAVAVQQVNEDKTAKPPVSTSSPPTPPSHSSPSPSNAPPPPSPPPPHPSPPPPTPKPKPKPQPKPLLPSPPPPPLEFESPPPSISPPPPEESHSPPPQSGSVQSLSSSDSPSSRPTKSSKSSPPPPPRISPPPPPPRAISPSSLFSQSAASNTSINSPSPTTRNATAISNGTASHSTTASPLPLSSSQSDSPFGAAIGAILGAVAGVFIILLLGILFLFVKRKRRRVGPYSNRYRPPPNFAIPSDRKNYNGQNPMGLSGQSDGYSLNSFGSQHGGNMYHGRGGGGPEIGSSKSIFSYEELMEITSEFSLQNIIGEGGFGCVFEGQLPDGRAVAVKQLKAGSGQGEREFRAEVDIISRVHHRHLVSLVGYCISEHRRLLIYEFVPNKTLEHHLHGKGMPVLEWTKRLKIALGSAKGLAYLHEDCHPKIIHRDIKSANILLDDAFEAQVADFGLAKLTNDANTHVSTRVMGTFGYLAPEYASSGKLTDRSDVFSFGVVLLELLTGRKPVDSSQPLGDESLVEWARPCLVRALESGDFSELVDPRLGKNYVESEIVRMIEAAAACIRHSAPKRPRMAQVVRALDCEGELSDLSNGVKYGQSTVYNSNQYSEDITRFRRMALGDDDSREYESDAFNLKDGSQWKSSESSSEFLSGREHETWAMNAAYRSKNY